MSGNSNISIGADLSNVGKANRQGFHNPIVPISIGTSALPGNPTLTLGINTHKNAQRDASMMRDFGINNISTSTHGYCNGFSLGWTFNI